MVEYPIELVDRRWTLYVHINKINNKKYVGITSKQNPSNRWGKNGSNYKNTAHFYNAIQKYGWDNFEHIILEKELTKNEASNLEMILIIAWKTRDEKYGYNYQIGGYTGNFGIHMREESKDKISSGNSPHSKKVVCLNTRKIYLSQTDAANEYNIGSACEIGAVADGVHQFAGYDKNNTPLIWVRYEDYITMNDEQINNRLNMTIKRTNEKDIICLNTMQIFNGVASASRYCGSSTSGIIRCAQSWIGNQTGHVRRHSGKHPDTGEQLSWIYKNDYDRLSDNERNEIFNILKIRRNV